MLKFLINKTIKSNDFENMKNRTKLIRLTGLMGLVINLILFGMKLAIGLISGSIAIISDSVNNLSDSMTSLVTIYGAYVSGKPADKEHPFGHGRFEYIASMLVGLFILVIGFELLKNSISSIFQPQALNTSYITIIILVISISLKFYMYLYNKKVHHMTESLLNSTVARDSLNDVIATSLVLVSVILFRLFDVNIDGYVGIAISLLVLKSGIEIFIEIADLLMGKEISQEQLDQMKEIILQGKYIKGVHQIEIHEYGKGSLYGSCHVEAPANIDAYSMHKIVNEVENRVYREMGIQLSIHIDPDYLLEEDHFVKIDDESVLKKIDK